MKRSVQIFTLFWENVDKRMVKAHQRVMDALGLPVTYCRASVGPGEWMDAVMAQTQLDIVGFLDIDCVPVNTTIVTWSAKYAYDNATFVGLAQASNHIPPKSHIYAAPGFFFVARQAWERMGKPSFQPTRRADVAEEVSYRAEGLGLRYRALYPTHFEREPIEGVWRLHNYGFYGIGTLFEGGVYHLYQGRFQRHLELFEQRCGEIAEGRFAPSGFFASVDFGYQGRIVA